MAEIDTFQERDVPDDVKETLDLTIEQEAKYLAFLGADLSFLYNPLETLRVYSRTEGVDEEGNRDGNVTYHLTARTKSIPGFEGRGATLEAEVTFPVEVDGKNPDYNPFTS